MPLLPADLRELLETVLRRDEEGADDRSVIPEMRRRRVGGLDSGRRWGHCETHTAKNFDPIYDLARVGCVRPADAKLEVSANSPFFAGRSQ